MCGIVGAVCATRCSEFVLDALKKIEYRGYDSAGICLKNKSKTYVYKTEGYIDKLRQIVPTSLSPVAIAHTRWATHGRVCAQNAHPISSEDGLWTIVHNGIIENFDELKDKLIAKGVKFSTETDSEVIAALLALETFSEPIKNMAWVAKKLKGSFAFCAVKKDAENAIFSARSGSPLYAYHNIDMAMIASDPICFPNGKYYKLEDRQICKITQKNINFYDFSGKKLPKTANFSSNIEFSTDKGNFSHFMLKEIHETSKTLLNLSSQLERLNFEKIKTMKFDSVKLIGCGTAYHSCLLGASFIRSALKIDAEALQASEYRYGNYVIRKSTLCIFVSQSGETADTIAAYQKAALKTQNLIVLTNVLHSTMADMCENTIPICAGAEIAVASTKAYSNQVAAMYVLAQLFNSYGAFTQAIEDVVDVASNLVFDDKLISGLAKQIVPHDKVFFIGKGEDYVTALEGSLKLKEISYINCSAFPAGELKHGSLALIEDGTPIIVIATERNVLEKTMNSALEAKSRGAKLYLISQFELSEENSKNFEQIITIKSARDGLKNISAVIPLQLLSYYVSVQKNIDPDKPRNLAKSVTVE